MFLDPKPLPHRDRVQLAEQLVQRVLAVRGRQVLAIGLYGSLARGTDQLYSDFASIFPVIENKHHQELA